MEYIELEVWKETRVQVNSIYQFLKSFPKEENYRLTSQIRRCTVSMPSNITEGCGRQSSKETMHFLHIARGSLFELGAQLILANDLNSISLDTDTILAEVERVKKMLNGFINCHRTL